MHFDFLYLTLVYIAAYVALQGLSHSLKVRFTKFHSCDIVHTVDSGKISVLVLLDLSAAFDTVDHSVMLQVLRDHFCFRD